jgi:hypothetical protein
MTLPKEILDRIKADAEKYWIIKPALPEIEGAYIDGAEAEATRSMNESVLFAQWMEENCVRSTKGYFLDELISGKVENEFTIPELYEIFKSNQ